MDVVFRVGFLSICSDIDIELGIHTCVVLMCRVVFRVVLQLFDVYRYSYVCVYVCGPDLDVGVRMCVLMLVCVFAVIVIFVCLCMFIFTLRSVFRLIIILLGYC